MTAITLTPQETTGAAARASRAGFVTDLLLVAGRAIRSIGREPEFVAPAIVIPLFFFFVQTGALDQLTADLAPGFDYQAFVLPACIIFGVTGISRAGVVVTDIQGLPRPPAPHPDPPAHPAPRDDGRRHGAGGERPHPAGGRRRPALGRRVRDGGDRDPRLRRPQRAWRSPGSRMRDRPEDGEPRGGKQRLPPVLPLRLPHHLLRPPRGAQRMDGHGRRMESRHLRARRACGRWSPKGGSGTSSVKPCSPWAPSAC